MITYELNEKNDYEIKFQLSEPSGAPIEINALGSLLLTQYFYNKDIKVEDKYHLKIVNNRYNQNVRNANGVTVSPTCTITWTVSFNDTKKLDKNAEKELHVALFTWKYNSGTKRNSQEIYLWIRKIPFAF